MEYKTKARNYVAKHIGSLLFAVFRYSVKLYIWSIMHFHINILIIVSEIFSEECQTANILRWFIHLETEYHIILRGKSELLCIHIRDL